jgi:hypothetical protein
VLSKGTSWHLWMFIQYIILELIPSTICLYPLFPFPLSWKSFNKYHFSIYFCMNTVFAPYSHSYILFSTPPSIPSSERTCSALLFSDFSKQEWHLCLLMLATKGISLCHFHECMYYNLVWFISLIFLLYTLVLFLKDWFQPVKKFYIHSCRQCIKHTHFILLLSPSLIFSDFPLAWCIFHNIAAFALGLYTRHEEKHAAFGLLNLTYFA